MAEITPGLEVGLEAKEPLTVSSQGPFNLNPERPKV